MGKSRLSLWRICQECNKEYELDGFDPGRPAQSWTYCICPNCGKRDDPWIMVKRCE